MLNPVIDLRELRNALKGGSNSRRELPAGDPDDEPFLPEPEADDDEGAVGRESEGHDERLRRPYVLLDWTAWEFEHEPSRSVLLLAFGGILALGGVVTVFFGNALFAIFLLIAGGLLFASAFRAPRDVSCAVTSRGVKIGNRIYEFGDLQSFWIHYDPPIFRELVVVSRKTFLPVIRAPLGDLDPLRLREILLRFLREERREPSAMDVISKHLGF